jgi:hypothetical protein
VRVICICDHSHCVGQQNQSEHRVVLRLRHVTRNPRVHCNPHRVARWHVCKHNFANRRSCSASAT